MVEKSGYSAELVRATRSVLIEVAHILVGIFGGSFNPPHLAHVLTRAIGLEAHVEPHFFEAELAPGDLVLLCSDGVTTALSEDRLAELLSRQATAASQPRNKLRQEWGP